MGWRRFFQRAWWDEERARELESYLDLETDDNIARGMSPDEARAAARRKLGDTGRIREEIYTMNSVTPLDWLVQDSRYAVRVLRRTPGFTLAAMFTLALGIGGVTVIYSALRNILLDPFPYAESDRMVNVQIRDVETGRFHQDARFSDQEFLALAGAQSVLEYSVASTDFREVVRRDGGGELVRVTYMTPNTFPFLGVQPLLGRVFTDDDARPGASPVVVLDHGVWTRSFGGDRSVVGQVITVGSTPRTIIGVMPSRFAWQAAAMWVPHDVGRAVERADGSAWRWAYQGRLKAGVTHERATSEMTALAQRRALMFPEAYPGRLRADVLDLRYKVVGRFSLVLYTLLAAVSLLLLIACCNVANMLLARATTREREMTVRLALGGSRVRLMAQLLTEAGLLALGGAVGGVLLAWAGLHAVAAILPRAGVAWEVQLRLVPEALVASLVIAALTTLIVGTVPAWHASRQDLASGMKESGKGTGASHTHGWVRQSLVVIEVALSLVLLLGAGVLIQRFVTLVRTGLGIDTSRIAYVSPRFERPDVPGQAQRHQYFTDALARVRTVPGVSDAAIVTGIGGRPFEVVRPGVEPRAGDQALGTFCDDRFLGLVGLPLLRGRLLTPADIESAARVAVISQSMADRYFAHEDPLGQYFELPQLAEPPFSLADVTFHIVGIVADFSNAGPGQPAWPSVYLPTSLTAPGHSPRDIVAWTTAGVDPAVVTPGLARAVAAASPDVAIARAASLDADIRDGILSQPRFLLFVLTTFAAVGLLLVAVGLYGVVAFTVSRRAQEFAIRMALGATGAHVLTTVVRSGLLLMATGVVLGLPGSRMANRLIATIEPAAPADSAWAAVGAVSVIAVVGLAACVIPARRAARTSPMVALRQD